MSSRTLLGVLYTNQRGYSDFARLTGRLPTAITSNGQMRIPRFLYAVTGKFINLLACGWRLELKE